LAEHETITRPAEVPDALALLGRLVREDSEGFQLLAEQVKSLDDAIGSRLNALFDAFKEEMAKESAARQKLLRSEMERVLFIQLGMVGVALGGLLWLILKP
jgi:hypothetical protein